MREKPTGETLNALLNEEAAFGACQRVLLRAQALGGKPTEGERYKRKLLAASEEARLKDAS